MSIHLQYTLHCNSDGWCSDPFRLQFFVVLNPLMLRWHRTTVCYGDTSFIEIVPPVQIITVFGNSIPFMKVTTWRKPGIIKLDSRNLQWCFRNRLQIPGPRHWVPIYNYSNQPCLILSTTQFRLLISLLAIRWMDWFWRWSSPVPYVVGIYNSDFTEIGDFMITLILSNDLGCTIHSGASSVWRIVWWCMCQMFFRPMAMGRMMFLRLKHMALAKCFGQSSVALVKKYLRPIPLKMFGMEPTAVSTWTRVCLLCMYFIRIRLLVSQESGSLRWHR